eukprot:TRINITY_DN56458_c0_g1_i1.p2 TRINITY_DN56458_c0_g1~~TRINITY_DN56458_c0_g1_i1.p2  ORF type:complete len:196 (+),score=57.22 TRINITY_DN56458_c0_g1_i1:93-680(+)
MDLILNHDLNAERQARAREAGRKDYEYQSLQVQARRQRPRDFVTPKISGDRYFEIDPSREHANPAFTGAAGQRFRRESVPAAPQYVQGPSWAPAGARNRSRTQQPAHSAPWATDAPPAAPPPAAGILPPLPQQALPGEVAPAPGMLQQQNDVLQQALLQMNMLQQQASDREWEARHAELRALCAANLKQSQVSYL